MAVAAHLGIQLDQYDSKIRSFIPDYELLLDTVVDVLTAIGGDELRVVDLGTGTGALADRVLRSLPRATVTAVDEDLDVLDLARERLAPHGGRATMLAGSFVELLLPPSDAIVASLALHHVRTVSLKRALYRSLRKSLTRRGVLMLADCMPAANTRLATLQREAWRQHMRLAHSEAEVDAYFAAWSKEDVYFPLEEELEMLASAGYQPDVVWRRGMFAVIAAFRTDDSPPPE